MKNKRFSTEFSEDFKRRLRNTAEDINSGLLKLSKSIASSCSSLAEGISDLTFSAPESLSEKRLNEIKREVIDSFNEENFFYHVNIENDVEKKVNKKNKVRKNMEDLKTKTRECLERLDESAKNDPVIKGNVDALKYSIEYSILELKLNTIQALIDKFLAYSENCIENNLDNYIDMSPYIEALNDSIIRILENENN